jgi:acylaminoacyl-peptidase
MSVPLIPRKLLFGNASRVRPRLSPDGTMLSWCAPVDGVMNIWLAPVNNLEAATPLTRTQGRPIFWHEWSADGRFVMFLNDFNGDENDHLFVADAASGELRDITPYDGVNAQLLLLSPDLPDSVFVALNDRDASWHDVWKIDLETGKRTLVYENTERFGSFLLDLQGNLRLARRPIPGSGDAEVCLYANGAWTHWRVVPFEDDLATWQIAFNRAGTHLSVVSSADRDTSALIRIHLATGEEEVLASHPSVDVGDNYLLHPATFEVAAISCEPLRQQWIVLDPEIEADFALIQERFPGQDFSIHSVSDDFAQWIVTSYSAEDPSVYHLLSRSSGTLHELFRARPELVPYQMAGKEGVVIKSRDGLDLVSFLSLPPMTGPRPVHPLPMVLLVHGGPWGRDYHGYDNVHQWLANRGYAVLSVNYRASSGFGKAFLNAGDREHAGKMHDDLIDAVEWAIAAGIADRSAVAIMGWSYGGYAAFVGATFTPDVFACTVPIVGITDLVTMMENSPPYWADFMEHLHRRYADVRTEEGRAWLRSRSPLYRVDSITKPMLIGHGANDVRCTVAQSDLIVDAMQKKGLDVTYVVYPDEGHGFARPENSLSFFAITEAFLARQLGGRFEPVGEDFAGSSHEIRAGGDFL